MIRLTGKPPVAGSGGVPVAARTLIASLALWLAAGAPTRAADYVVRTGDVLEFAIPSLKLQLELPVRLDGMVSLPRSGDVQADGVPLPELAERIRTAFSGKSYTLRTIDGQEVTTAVTPAEIVVSVAEYRPVYLSGDVSRPGAQTYRPGMTAGQAVALSGGYDLVQFRIDDPSARLYELRSDYNAAWVDAVGLTARIRRIAAALGRPVEPPGALDRIQSPLTPAATAVIEEAQNQEIDAKLKQANDQIRTIGTRIGEQQKRLKTLLTQVTTEGQTSQLDRSEEQRTNDLVQRGITTNTYATYARRLSLDSATRLLNADVQAERVRKETEGLEQDSQRLTDELSLYLNQELASGTAQLAKALSKRDRLWQKMLYYGVLRSQLVSGAAKAPEIFVTREVDKKWQRLAAREDTALDPGDVVEVRVRLTGSDPGR